KYVTGVTVTSLTVIEVTTTFSSTFALQQSEDDRAEARREAEKEFREMSEAMVAEKGLLNHAQAALLLDVSTKRVGELDRLGNLGGTQEMSEVQPDGNRTVTLREAADFLRVCVRTVRREIERGELIAFRVGRGLRIRMSDLKRYVERNAVGVAV